MDNIVVYDAGEATRGNDQKRFDILNAWKARHDNTADTIIYENSEL